MYAFITPSCLQPDTDISIHRVGRVLSFFFSRRNWDSPLPRRRICTPRPGSGGRGTLAGERGVGESQFRRGYSLYLRTLCIHRSDHTFIQQRKHPTKILRDCPFAQNDCLVLQGVTRPASPTWASTCRTSPSQRRELPTSPRMDFSTLPR